jgi:hypothetical protein
MGGEGKIKLPKVVVKGVNFKLNELKKYFGFYLNGVIGDIERDGIKVFMYGWDDEKECKIDQSEYVDERLLKFEVERCGGTRVRVKLRGVKLEKIAPSSLKLKCKFFLVVKIETTEKEVFEVKSNLFEIISHQSMLKKDKKPKSRKRKVVEKEVSEEEIELRREELRVLNDELDLKRKKLREVKDEIELKRSELREVDSCLGEKRVDLNASFALSLFNIE